MRRPGGSLLGVALDSEEHLPLRQATACRAARLGRRGSIEDLTSAVDRDAGVPLPNSLAFGTFGELYVSDSGRLGEADGRILCLRRTASSRPATEDRFQYTNGLAVATDGGSLFVVETDLRASRCCRSVHREYSGSRCGLILPRTVPDGIPCSPTATGHWLPLWRPDGIVMPLDGGVTIVTEDWRGLVLSAPTGACFFGEDMGSLAVANRGGGHLSVVEIGLTGPLPHRPDGLPRRRPHHKITQTFVQGVHVRITAIHQATVPISSPIRNAARISFADMATSVVAIVHGRGPQRPAGGRLRIQLERTVRRRGACSRTGSSARLLKADDAGLISKTATTSRLTRPGAS